MQFRIALISTTLAAAAAPVMADNYFSNFETPITYGHAGTTYQEWQGFASVAGANTPVAVSNSNIGTLNAYDSTSATDGAFLTGGHIYSFSAAITPTVIVPEQNLGAGHYTMITFQVDTLGTEPDIGTFHVSGTDGISQGATSTKLLNQTPLGGFGGFEDQYEATFLLAGNASQYTLSVTSDSSSMSFAGARADTAVGVPEPTAMHLLAIAGLLLRRRK